MKTVVVNLFCCVVLLPALGANAQPNDGQRDLQNESIRDTYATLLSADSFIRINFISRPAAGQRTSLGYAYAGSSTSDETISIVKDMERTGLPMDITVNSNSVLSSIRVGDTTSTNALPEGELNNVVLIGFEWINDARTLYFARPTFNQPLPIGRVQSVQPAKFQLALHAMASSKSMNLTVGNAPGIQALRINP